MPKYVYSQGAHDVYTMTYSCQYSVMTFMQCHYNVEKDERADVIAAIVFPPQKYLPRFFSL